jgi:hypothetical protein
MKMTVTEAYPYLKSLVVLNDCLDVTNQSGIGVKTEIFLYAQVVFSLHPSPSMQECKRLRRERAIPAERAKLQWTCRLRDVLERQLIFPDRAKVHWAMTEAKFICDDGLFPDDFRWETFAGCYSQEVVYVNLGRPAYLPIDPNYLSYQEIRSLSGKEVTDLTERKH